MKKNEIITLDGKEYTLELNRDSFLKIDQYTNLKKSVGAIKEDLYEYKEEIDENENPFADVISDEEMDKFVEEKDTTLKKMITRAFWIWLYPNHKLNINQVEEILKSEFDNDEKYNKLAEKYSELLNECVEIKTQYEEERKNLKAQANK